MNNLIKVAFRNRTFFNYTECKRYAGHSKWANIKHIKMEKDGQRQQAMSQLLRHIKVAIAEGKSAKPEDNVKLARVIENAKKKSLPMGPVKNFLEKAQASKVVTQSMVVESRGPSGCIVLIHLLADNIALARNNVNYHLKKTKFGSSSFPITQGLFDQKGVILTEIDDIDKAVEDAIEVGAEDAEKCKEDDKEFLQFTCNHVELLKVRNALEEKNYKIISADVEYIAKVSATLKDNELEMLNKLYEKLQNEEDVYKVYNNVIN